MYRRKQYEQDLLYKLPLNCTEKSAGKIGSNVDQEITLLVRNAEKLEKFVSDVDWENMMQKCMVLMIAVMVVIKAILTARTYKKFKQV